MPGAYRPKAEDGKPAKLYTCWWIDEGGKRRTCKGTAERASSLKIAHKKDEEAKLIKAGLLDRAELRQRESSLKSPIDHIEDYRADLEAKGDTLRHCKHIASVLKRLVSEASIKTIAEMPVDRVQSAIARLRLRNGKAASARTRNHTLRAFRAWCTWLVDAGRLKEVPRGLGKIPIAPESADRRYERRALTPAELAKLLEATASGPTILTRRDRKTHKVLGELTGPERVILYRIAMATGFRANELRSLTPECFHLEGDSPTITVRAAYSKRGKRSGRDDVQPIAREVAEVLKPWLATRPPGVPVLAIPEKTGQMLADDLTRAEIPIKDERGRIADFHCLRHTFITHLVARGINPKTVQRLARHSSIQLTFDRYTHVEEEDLRNALEGNS